MKKNDPITADLPALAPNLRAKIKAYKKKITDMESFLREHPQEWGRFQSEFNQEINGIFRDLMLFEKEQMARGDEAKVYKLKRLFIDWFRDDFVKGEYVKWCLQKPFGYSGDFKIIDDIYWNHPTTTGFERLYDNYFQMSTICIAVRNRKEDFKRIFRRAVELKKNCPARILNLASGSCRDVAEILADRPWLKGKDFILHCFENDPRAIEYARKVVEGDPHVVFFRENAVRLALKKDVDPSLRESYDLIFSTGLFDYLGTTVSIRLIRRLRELLKTGGVLAISDVRDKFSNPSVHFMEWVGDWNLTYRNDDDFRRSFVEAGFSEKDLSCEYEQQGLMQYILATK